MVFSNSTEEKQGFPANIDKWGTFPSSLTVRRRSKIMSYTVSHVKKIRESFDEYRYGIYENGKIIAYFWHDYRGDDNGIEFVNGISAYDPVGSRANFLEGGGPQPLTLSKRAIKYIIENRP